MAIATLLEGGHRVRAMVRTPDARADTLRDMGAEVVVADMLDIIGVRAAMQGCSVMYFTMSISPNYLEAAANVAVTAKSLGVKAFVHLSQMTVSEMSESETTSSPHQKQHWLAERNPVLVWPAGGLPAPNGVRRHVPGAGGQGHPRGRHPLPFADEQEEARADRPARRAGLPRPLCWRTQNRTSARSTN